jgi:hypothetical protein
MLWARKSKPAKNIEPVPLLIGLDVNSSRARAVQGLGEATPRALPLDGEGNELALIIGLEGRQPHLGREAAALVRRSPHLTCQDFLAFLGEPREWTGGRHRLDAAKAAGLLVQRLKPACADGRGLVLSVPGYLSRPQIALLTPLLEKAGVPLFGSVRAALAAGLTAHALSPWQGRAVSFDVDDHAFSAATLIGDGDQLWVQSSHSWPKLNMLAWKVRLLNAVADRCVRQSRRDPRDSAIAEQALYDQLDHALVHAREHKPVEILVQTAQWYQSLILQPNEIDGFCRRLVEQTMEHVRELIAPSANQEPLQRVLVGGAVWRLPGLIPELEATVEQAGPITAVPVSADDFGEALLPVGSEPALVARLAEDAVARGAYELALRMQRGDLPRGHYELSISLPKSEPPGPAAAKNVRLYSEDAEI